MRTPAARAIVIRDGKLLVIKRQRDGDKYMVLPGGHIEDGEKPESTALREVQEETTVNIHNPRLVFVEEHINQPNDRWGTQFIYLCDYVGGEPMLYPESEEYAIQQRGEGYYEPLWFDMSHLPNSEYPFRSIRLGEEIMKAHTNGFPRAVVNWRYDSL